MTCYDHSCGSIGIHNRRLSNCWGDRYVAHRVTEPKGSEAATEPDLSVFRDSVPAQQVNMSRSNSMGPSHFGRVSCLVMRAMVTRENGSFMSDLYERYDDVKQLSFLQ